MMRLVFITLFSIAIVVILYVASDDDEQKYHEFTRVIYNDLTVTDTIEVPNTVSSIASFEGNTVFVKDNTNPYTIHSIDLSTHLVSAVKVSVASTHKLKLTHPQLHLHSSFFILADGGLPLVLRGREDTWQAKEFMPYSAYFVDCIPISESSIVIQSVSRGKYVLGKQTVDTPYVKLNPFLLQKQVDGIFCSDGMLRYNRDLKRLIYVYFYRNQFIQIDTALNLLARSNTIDPIDTAQIEIVSTGSGTKTHLKPPLSVNKHAWTSNKWLFINSAIRAKNERPNEFKKVSVVDIYDLHTGLYHHSFYVPSDHGTKMKDFAVTNGVLVTLFEGKIITYELRITARY